MTLSEQGYAFLIRREGKQSKVYIDSGGYGTIGIGHKLTQDEIFSGNIVINGDTVSYENGLTDKQIILLMIQDVNRFEDTVNKSVKIDLEQHQYDTMVSFSFNVGCEAFSTSTLLKQLNLSNFSGIRRQLRRWNKVAGKIDKGLINRRQYECNLFEDGDYA